MFALFFTGFEYARLLEMTADVVRALTISASVLLAVLILIIIISMVTVRRGEIGMADDNKHRGQPGPH